MTSSRHRVSHSSSRARWPAAVVPVSSPHSRRASSDQFLRSLRSAGISGSVSVRLSRPAMPVSISVTMGGYGGHASRRKSAGVVGMYRNCSWEFASTTEPSRSQILPMCVATSSAVSVSDPHPRVMWWSTSATRPPDA